MRTVLNPRGEIPHCRRMHGAVDVDASRMRCKGSVLRGYLAVLERESLIAAVRAEPLDVPEGNAVRFRVQWA